MYRTLSFILILLFSATTVFATPKRVIRHVNNDGSPAVSAEPDRDDPHRDPVDVISYDDGNSLEFYITLPEGSGFDDSSYNVRFSPVEAPFSLIGLQVVLFNMDDRNGNPGMEVAVFSSDDDGFPQEELVTFEVPNNDLNFSQAEEILWNRVSFTDYNVEPVLFEGNVDFHIALNVIQGNIRDTLAVFLDNGEEATNRSGFWSDDDNMWELILNAYEVGHNFTLRAVVEYPDPEPPAIAIDPENVGAEGGGELPVTISNTGGSPLLWRTEVETFVEPEEPERPWILWEPEEGEIAPDDEAQVMVTVNLDGLVAGIYAASLHFLSNDPNNPDVALNIMINTIYLHIEVTPEELDFGIVDDPEPRSEILTVSNIGNVLLTITSVRIHPDSPLVTDFENEIHIEPRESSEITVTYTPDVPGELHTQILISSNADEALLRVPVYALYISPPTIGVDPLIIESFDGGEYPMTLTNEGGSPLEWSTTIDAEWLSIEPSAGQNDFWVETNLVLSIDTTGLASGNYDTDLIFNSNDPVTPELAIGISLEVTELGVSGDFQTPEGFGLNTIYPNPFNSTSTISFSLDTQGEVSLQMFDMTGQLLRDLIPGTNMGQGEYKIIVEAADLPAGSYSIRLQQNYNIQTQTISLIK